jgi:hypothetical protein
MGTSVLCCTGEFIKIFKYRSVVLGAVVEQMLRWPIAGSWILGSARLPEAKRQQGRARRKLGEVDFGGIIFNRGDFERMNSLLLNKLFG